MRSKSEDQLREALSSLRRNSSICVSRLATGQLEKTHRAGEVRRDIARIKTLMREKARQGA